MGHIKQIRKMMVKTAREIPKHQTRQKLLARKFPQLLLTWDLPLCQAPDMTPLPHCQESLPSYSPSCQVIGESPDSGRCRPHRSVSPSTVASVADVASSVLRQFTDLPRSTLRPLRVRVAPALHDSVRVSSPIVVSRQILLRHTYPTYFAKIRR